MSNVVQKLLNKIIKKKNFVIIQDLVNGEIINEKKYEVHPKFPNLTICGKEIPNPKPIVMPASVKAKLQKGQSPRDMIKKMLAEEKAALAADGYETEEEFMDIDMEDIDYQSSYEFEHQLHEELLTKQSQDFVQETLSPTSSTEQSEESEPMANEAADESQGEN